MQRVSRGNRTLRDRVPQGRFGRFVRVVLLASIASGSVVACSSSKVVFDQTPPLDFRDAGLGVNQTCDGDCQVLVSNSVEPPLIESPGDGEWSVTYTFENLAKPTADGSGDGFFLTEFELYQTDGGGTGRFVPSRSTCPTTDRVPVLAGAVFTCTATIRLEGVGDFMGGSYWSGSNFSGTATIVYLGSSWSSGVQPYESTLALRKVSVEPAPGFGTNE